jgi:hypothetical protein
MEDNWFSREPESEDRMTHVSYRHTPCEQIRQIYKRVQDPEIKLMLRVAATMAKSMATRLTKYEGKGWGQKVYPKNPYYPK